MELTATQVKKIESASKRLSEVLKEINRKWKTMQPRDAISILSDARWDIALSCDEIDAVLSQAKTMKGKKTTTRRK